VRALALVWALVAVGCTNDVPGEALPAPLPETYQPSADRALDYLEATDSELGLDVVVMVQILGETTGDPRAAEVVDALVPRLRDSDVERYGALLEMDKPRLRPASLEGAEPGVGDPDPLDDLMDDRVQRCPVEALECRVDDACRGFVELDDRGGYVLTHQALWLVFAHWAGCETGIDVEERRRAFAASLVRGIRADTDVDDLYGERIALLGHLGFASEIEPAWVDALLEAQQPEGCFPVDGDVSCHPHPTGLALWTLSHTAVSRE